MLGSIKQCIQNLCQYARLTKVLNGKDAQVYEGQALDQSLKMRAVMPWGISCRPPVGTQLLRWSTNGQKNNSAAMAFDSSTRFDDIEEGEIVFGNQTTRAKIYFDKNGNIVIATPKGDVSVDVTDGDLNINVSENANVNINGSADISVTESASLTVTEFLTMSVGESVTWDIGETLTINAENVAINSSTLTHNNINVGSTHQHPNGNNGNPTGTPF